MGRRATRARRKRRQGGLGIQHTARLHYGEWRHREGRIDGRFGTGGRWRRSLRHVWLYRGQERVARKRIAGVRH